MTKIIWESINWNTPGTLGKHQYDCGFCGDPTTSEKGYHGDVHMDALGSVSASIYICNHCGCPTFFDPHDNQHPGSKYGSDVDHVDDESVDAMYEEARLAFGAKAYTASVMCCRKILMNIAVSKGAKKNETYKFYVNYLVDNNIVSALSEEWVDHIRDKGNDANHEIERMEKEDAEELINFVGILLKTIYEFPSIMERKEPSKTE